MNRNPRAANSGNFTVDVSNMRIASESEMPAIVSRDKLQALQTRLQLAESAADTAIAEREQLSRDYTTMHAAKRSHVDRLRFIIGLSLGVGLGLGFAAPELLVWVNLILSAGLLLDRIVGEP